MAAYEYEVIPFNGYWWLIRTLPQGKHSRIKQFANEKEARVELEAVRRMIQRQIADAKARIAHQQRHPAPTEPRKLSPEAEWINDRPLGDKS